MSVNINEEIVDMLTPIRMISALLGLMIFVSCIVPNSANSYASEVKPAAPAEAKSPAEGSITTFVDNGWAPRCQDLKEGEKVTGKYCEAVQRLTASQKDADPSKAQRVAEIAIGYPPESKNKAQGAAILPLGIMVDQKVTLEVDGEKITTLTVKYCENAGCLATFTLDSGDIRQLREGKQLSFKTTAATGQAVHIALSLNGFGAVMDQVHPQEE